MAETIPIIQYKHYTKLLLRLSNKVDNAGAVLEISTPHKGIVIVELTKIDKGLFRSAKELYKQTDEVISEIRKIEYEAKDYLLDKWLNPNLQS